MESDDSAMSISPTKGSNNTESNEEHNETKPTPSHLIVKNGAENSTSPKVKSILGDAARRQNQTLIVGHTNIKKDLKKGKKVKIHSESARVEDHIHLEHMKTLKNRWAERNGELDEADFYDSLWQVIGSDLGDKFESHVGFLFKKMDTNQDGMVDWDEFCTYMMIGLQEKDDLSAERETPLLLCHDSFGEIHNARIVRVQALSNPTRFVSFGEDGVTAMYNMQMVCTSQLNLDAKAFLLHKSLKVTDAVYLANSYRYVLATTARDLRFYHSTNGICTNKLDVHSIIMCLDYWFDIAAPDNAKLIFGDINGSVTMITFTGATASLFDAKIRGWQEEGRLNIRECLEAKHDGFDHVVTAEQFDVHSESGSLLNQAIVDIRYIHEMESFITCTSTSKASMVVFDLGKASNDMSTRMRKFQILKGLKCFDYSTELSLIVTGGADCKVRIWNPYVAMHAKNVFHGHTTPVVSVAFNSSYSQVISVSDSEIIKIWSITERVCLNTLGGVIPNTVQLAQHQQRLGRMLWHNQSQSAIICTSNRLAVIQLLRDETFTASKGAHPTPVTCCVVIPELKLICTGCSGGWIMSWQLYTGEKVLEFENAHGTAAISCLAVDHNGRRLISGASNGDIFVWNVLSGVVLQKMIKTQIKEISGLMSTPSGLYSIGWDGCLIHFNDDSTVDISRAPVYVPQTPHFNPVDKHHDDVLTVTMCGTNLIASGSFDGIIIVWNLKLGKAAKKFDSTSYRKKWKNQHRDELPITRSNSRNVVTEVNDTNVPTSKRLTTGVVDDGSPFPRVSPTAKKAVEQLIWLKQRVKIAAGGQRDVATLVASCDGGCIVFWNALKGEMLLAFYAVDNDYGLEAIHGLVTDAKNNRLYTGCTLGNVKVWDISNSCLNGIETEAPKLINEWDAHEGGISTMEIVDSANLIVTCSLDHSVRVWNNESGDFIGSFGGQSTWDIVMAQSIPNSSANTPRTQRKVQRRSTMIVADNMAQMFETDIKKSTDFRKVAHVLGPIAATTSDTNDDGIDESDDGGAVVESIPRQQSVPPTLGDLEEEDEDDDEGMVVSQIPKLPSIIKSSPTKAQASNDDIDIDFERPSILGRKFMNSAKRRQKKKTTSRSTVPEFGDNAASIQGLHICVPYNSLKLCSLEKLQRTREPSAVGRMKMSRLRLMSEEGDRRGNRKVRGNRVGKSPKVGRKFLPAIQLPTQKQ